MGTLVESVILEGVSGRWVSLEKLSLVLGISSQRAWSRWMSFEYASQETRDPWKPCWLGHRSCAGKLYLPHARVLSFLELRK